MWFSGLRCPARTLDCEISQKTPLSYAYYGSGWFFRFLEWYREKSSSFSSTTGLGVAVEVLYGAYEKNKAHLECNCKVPLNQPFLFRLIRSSAPLIKGVTNSIMLFVIMMGLVM